MIKVRFKYLFLLFFHWSKLFPLTLILTLSLIVPTVGSAGQSQHLTLQSSILIEAPAQKVYQFVSDAANDVYWRSEVHAIHHDIKIPVAPGKVYLEDAMLGIHPHYLTEVQIEQLVDGELALYKTTPRNGFQLVSERRLQRFGENQTKLTYKVQVQRELVYDIWGFEIPPFYSQNWLPGIYEVLSATAKALA